MRAEIERGPASGIPAARRVRPNFALTHVLAAAKAFGVPRYAVAHEAGISPARLSAFTTGAAKPNAKQAQAIADALGGLPVEELFPPEARLHEVPEPPSVERDA